MKRSTLATLNIVEQFRDTPDEFYMLKGLLCAAHAIESKTEAEPFTPEWHKNEIENGIRRDIFSCIIDTKLVAERMDEINGNPVDSKSRLKRLNIQTGGDHG